MCFIRPYEQSCIGQEDLVLEDISIKDFVLIDSLSLDFSKGLTVFSGETGAGKSILIGAISFLLGGKGGVELVRDGASEARVSGSLYISPEHIEARQWLSEHHIELDENRLLLRRVLRSNGKSASWIQEAQVTKAEVQEFTALLVDIHGQHEHQSLMRPSEHRKFLDAYAGIENKVRDFTQLYTDLITKRQKMQAVQTSDAERKRKIEMLAFACEEIEALHIRVNEETELEEELSRLSQFEKLYETIQDMNQTLSTGDSALVSHLKKLHVSASHIEDLDKVL
ncbi:MAG TPA: DNA repair protein RecN, partial [Treponema sp.]|nr:DNA repair protein RecN [Treponema sp.]